MCVYKIKGSEAKSSLGRVVAVMLFSTEWKLNDLKKYKKSFQDCRIDYLGQLTVWISQVGHAIATSKVNKLRSLTGCMLRYCVSNKKSRTPTTATDPNHDIKFVVLPKKFSVLQRHSSDGYVWKIFLKILNFRVYRRYKGNIGTFNFGFKTEFETRQELVRRYNPRS